MLGLSRDDARAQIDDVIDFSELGEFIDAPVRTYSTGMTMRLSFAIAIRVVPRRPAHRRSHCSRRRAFLHQMHGRGSATSRRSGRTIVLVTHNTCSRSPSTATSRCGSTKAASLLSASVWTSFARTREPPAAGPWRMRYRRESTRWSLPLPLPISTAHDLPDCFRCYAYLLSDTCARLGRSRAGTRMDGPMARLSSPLSRYAMCAAGSSRQPFRQVCRRKAKSPSKSTVRSLRRRPLRPGRSHCAATGAFLAGNQRTSVSLRPPLITSDLGISGDVRDVGPRVDEVVFEH